MKWRIGLIDSCGRYPGAEETAAFRSEHRRLLTPAPGTDASGHGSRIASLLMGSGADPDLLLAQVFREGHPTSAAAVAAAIDWCVARDANLLHLSLGLNADRPVLRTAVEAALGAGVLIVAATPARGAPVFPAHYAGVIRGTADARCAPGELSVLGEARFGGHGSLPGAAPGQGGASAGAAWISRALLDLAPGRSTAVYTEALGQRARYLGPERRVS